MTDYDPHTDWAGANLLAALRESVQQVAEILGPLPPAGRVRVPANHPPGDFTVGDVVVQTNGGAMRWCRVCEQGIHTGAAMVAHYPTKPSVIADCYHYACSGLDAA